MENNLVIASVPNKLPVKYPRSLHAFLTNESIQSDKIVNGYLKQCRQEKELLNIMQLPFELIQLIIDFYNREYVHLIKTSNGKHWKTALDDILSF